ncbi:MAG: hypothetical protein AAGD05_12415 [Bacteroidota bacterium]
MRFLSDQDSVSHVQYILNAQYTKIQLIATAPALMNQVQARVIKPSGRHTLTIDRTCLTI